MEEQSSILQELREQRALLVEHDQLLKKMYKTARWNFALGMLRLLLVLVPIIIAIIYLPPLVERAMDSFSTFQQDSGLQLPQGLKVDDLLQLLER